MDPGIVNMAADSVGPTYGGGQVKRMVCGHTMPTCANADREGHPGGQTVAQETLSPETTFRGLGMKARDTRRRIALDDVTGIRGQITV